MATKNSFSEQKVASYKIKLIHQKHEIGIERWQFGAKLRKEMFKCILQIHIALKVSVINDKFSIIPKINH